MVKISTPDELLRTDWFHILVVCGVVRHAATGRTLRSVQEAQLWGIDAGTNVDQSPRRCVFGRFALTLPY